MNELQLALLGAGVVAIAAVWGYNALQERKHRKLAEAIFKGAQDDVLVQAPPGAIVAQTALPVHDFDDASEPREPAIPVYRSAAAPVSEEANGGESPALENVPDSALSEADNSRVSREIPLRNETSPDDLLPCADPVADCFVSFTVPAPISAEAVWAAQSAWRASLSKPLNWLARVDERSPWVHVSQASVERYGQWLAALQMVDR